MEQIELTVKETKFTFRLHGAVDRETGEFIPWEDCQERISDKVSQAVDEIAYSAAKNIWSNLTRDTVK